MKRLLKEPLLHFLLLGTALFVVFQILDSPDDRKGGEVVVTAGTIEYLRAAFSRVRQRPPSADELDGLIADYVREEVLAREAVALGLDGGDTVIRRRLRQKMEFIANDLAAQAEPRDEELRQYLTQHPDMFRLDPRLTFRQVYVNPERRGDAMEQHAAQLLAALHQASVPAEVDAMGVQTLLSPGLAEATAREVADMFGEPFAEQLLQLPQGRWQVRVTAAVPSPDESAALFGMDVAAKGIQPVWLRIENHDDVDYFFLPISLDPHYFLSREASLQRDIHSIQLSIPLISQEG